ncbi:undecaprenyl-diphosphatase UppP [Brucepastera parasyntrophica]|uniref:undecaprenyl-diphosphatase UppP n=1 Tax=Brucepastera parasyntrophica TaxID=2880008 RepID=UPI00210D12F4|nr:undecaprenyl-diphosphatase UppP [Brucepastera parasyntrophica]ULQ60940.1 undecaprenyl-diphosphatase UppP [Brucepastera parasyntrophica]
MNIAESVLLGFVQGLAEFLPVSSSGHLAIISYFIGQTEVPLLFDIMLHLATLAAVCIVFRRRIWELLCVVGRFIIRKPLESDRPDQKTIIALIAATAMTGIIGFILKDFVREISPFVISCCFVVTGILLFISGRFTPKQTVEAPNLVRGLIIGTVQGIGVIPGISRSGSTISASLFTGLDRRVAGEFSFLLSIPAILAAFILELKDADTLTGSVSAISLIAGMLTAFIVGLLSLKFLITLINKGKLGYFAFYLVPVGISLAIYFAVK